MTIPNSVALMTEITIRVPIPPNQCHPNRNNRHWAAVARAKKQARSEAHMCALSALDGRDPPRWVKATVSAHFNFRVGLSPFARPQKHDPDNLIGWGKAQRDGLADAGIVANDRGLIPLPPTYGYDERLPAGVTLTVMAG